MHISTARQSTDQIHRLLRDAILRAELRPGESISESRMALRFGVSRTPVREAFKRLVDENFLSVVPQVGTFVAAIDLAAVYDSQFVRETLECRIVVLAARHIQASGRERLAAMIEEQSQALKNGDSANFFRLDEAFHAQLAELSGHGSTWALIESVKAQLDRVRCLSLENEGWSEMILDEHGAIARHVAQGDEAGAERAMRAHLRTVFDAIQAIARRETDAFRASDRPPALD